MSRILTFSWDGVSSVGGSSDNFKFTGSKDIGTLTGDYTPALKPANEGEPVIVSFTDGVFSQSITYGGRFRRRAEQIRHRGQHSPVRQAEVHLPGTAVWL